MLTVIEVRNLSKKYVLGEAARIHGSFREILAQAVRKPWALVRGSSQNRNGKRDESFWALRDVSFDVHQGDTLGIIGSNGAGKSTLLKILSRITDPTEGHVKIRGQMASLLEVGTGFHPELTGRENIYMNGAILGMRKVEIDAAFDGILDFAGIGKFIDTPVKRYSSGMYTRLAFSIAANLDPEILIVDEVLAVGDVTFQKKCLRKMEEARSRARTVLFVSHNLAAVERLCTRGIVLQQGAVAFQGTSKEAVQYYLGNLADNIRHSGSHIVDLSSAPGRVDKYRPWLKRLELYTEDGNPLTGELPIGAGIKARITFDLESPCDNFDGALEFQTLTGLSVFEVHSRCEPNRIREERAGEQTLVCDIPNLPLAPGEYRINVGLAIANEAVDWVDGTYRLTIKKSDYFGNGMLPGIGLLVLPHHWTLEDDDEQDMSNSSIVPKSVWV